MVGGATYNNDLAFSKVPLGPTATPPRAPAPTPVPVTPTVKPPPAAPAAVVTPAPVQNSMVLIDNGMGAFWTSATSAAAQRGNPILEATDGGGLIANGQPVTIGQIKFGGSDDSGVLAPITSFQGRGGPNTATPANQAGGA